MRSGTRAESKYPTVKQMLLETTLRSPNCNYYRSKPRNRTSGPGRRPLDGKKDGPVAVRFRKHRRPCGQPTVVGEIGRFRPVPPQAGHLIRMKATPSDLPFKSTGFATYPEPPQFGQSSGATPSPPRVEPFSPTSAPNVRKSNLRYETRTNRKSDPRRARFRADPRSSS